MRLWRFLLHFDQLFIDSREKGNHLAYSFKKVTKVRKVRKRFTVQWCCSMYSWVRRTYNFNGTVQITFNQCRRLIKVDFLFRIENMIESE